MTSESSGPQFRRVRLSLASGSPSIDPLRGMIGEVSENAGEPGLWVDVV